eukprot:CAMPEP_0172528720 /NCGR_PEP_ID=MMETSP1067-20121228/3016_1 /TAXON_ID=265564 ORGANISM="Thalassiosira punctigera, Strain Tpunct2005C2" /NCGR_SAMPLE_ID=MMETSP1067 /ASSEMBLY_ACC=CAM_ASM_000444 /LENGTH=457 /DNA_ID=CAMNT_0013312677 /DNA_START=173 /DNA_END=1546 /DNA_ORIENTATION=+
MTMTSKIHGSYRSIAHKSSLSLPPINHFFPSCFVSPTSEWSRTVIRRSRSSILETKAIHNPPLLCPSYRWIHFARLQSSISSISFSAIFAHHDPKESEVMQMQRPKSETQPSPGTEAYAHHWFTQLLPEGLCVGVCTDRAVASAMSDNGEESILNSTTLLHSDEYQWGQKKIASDASRTSYYLGRMALRLALGGLSKNESGIIATDAAFKTNTERQIDMTRASGSRHVANSFFNQLNDQIQINAIMKDYHGRPILPEVVLGSISHKGEYAVGLARLRSFPSSVSNNVSEGLNSEEDMNGFKASVTNWREECPIDENSDVRYGGRTSLSSAVRGIGIDLEQIDSRRGKRIERKVLTDNEQKDLGRLEAIGISSQEEVLLRFSLKESVYKAMHPIICQYVGFQEAEVTPFQNGTAQVILNLTSKSHEQLGVVVRSASWKTVGDFFLTSASVGAVLDELK